ncbi:MAG: L-glyceraldehyde 3-phosphate reductase [Acetivibrio ethanolgignens]
MPYIAKKERYTVMEYRRSGKSGLKLPLVSLGLWHNFGTNDNFENMKQMCFVAFNNGITHFDLANNYGPVPGSAEENFGEILNSELKSYRDELIISTKAGYTMWEGPYGDWGSRKYLLASLDQSLKRMGLEYVDIFYHHRRDPETPLEETMEALDQAVKSGKALYAGISNYNGEDTKKAMEILKELHCPFVINQSRYYIFDRNIEKNCLKAFAEKNGCGIIAFSPLAQGLLTDKYIHGIPENSRAANSSVFLKKSDITEEKLAKIRALNEMAAERGQSLAEMALSWVLKDDAVTSVLIGASRPEQIEENVRIVGHTGFTQEELRRIEEINFGL